MWKIELQHAVPLFQLKGLQFDTILGIFRPRLSIQTLLDYLYRVEEVLSFILVGHMFMKISFANGSRNELEMMPPLNISSLADLS